MNILLQIQPCTSTNKQRTYTQFWFLQLTSMNQQELIHLADSHYLTDPVHHQYFLAPDFHAKQRNRRWNCWQKQLIIIPNNHTSSFYILSLMYKSVLSHGNSLALSKSSSYVKMYPSIKTFKESISWFIQKIFLKEKNFNSVKKFDHEKDILFLELLRCHSLNKATGQNCDWHSPFTYAP